MNLSELQSNVERLQQKLNKARDLLAEATSDPTTVSAELERTRAFAFDASALTHKETVSGCVDSLERYGFCVIDHVIPPDVVDAIREEVILAQATSSRNSKGIVDLFAQEGVTAEELLNGKAAENNVELRRVRRLGHPPKPPNEIIWMPQFAPHMPTPVITAVARRVLDDHLRISQLHLRFIRTDKTFIEKEGGDQFKRMRGLHKREWHTDWPHDLSAYGGNDPKVNVGCIRRPFPDVPMCLVMIFYLTDTDKNSGGTWIVPGSHKDRRNPRGPDSDIIVSAPIPGNMQVSAPAGSVFIQDSRCWHSTARHNPSRRARVGVVTRWCPWWLSVDDFAPGENYNLNEVCRPLTHEEYLALPPKLRPLMRHLCPDEQDTLQQPVLDRAEAARLRAKAGFLKELDDPDNLLDANAHIRVPLNETQL